MKNAFIILLFILALGCLFVRPELTQATSVNSDTLSTSAPGAAAMHTIRFTTKNVTPSGGIILITFPALAAGDSNDPTTPSASTFQLNGLIPADVQVMAGGVDITSDVSISSSNPTTTGDSPTISLSLGTILDAGTPVVIYLGCHQLGTDSCTSSFPVILNPTKTAATGVADIWKLTATLKDAGNTTLESGIINIATNDTVTVQATVQPFLSFIITGLPDKLALNEAATCGATHPATLTNAGAAASGNSVNLGAIGSGIPNYAAQQMSILSNAINGYVITATSSGKLTNPGSGSTIPDAQGTPYAPDEPAPVALNLKNGGFGIHICDAAQKVDTNIWGIDEEYFANPGNIYPYTLVKSTTPPATSGDSMILLYGVAVSNKTPGGTYKTSITYTATPLF